MRYRWLNILFAAITLSVHAKDLITIGFVHHGPPIDIMQDDTLVGGIVFDIGTTIAHKAGFIAAFQLLPTKRAEVWLAENKIHMLCLYNRHWLEKPERFIWGPDLTHYQEYFILNKEAPDIKSYEQLQGMTIAARLGYYYSPQLEDLFKKEYSVRLNRQDTDSLYRLLTLKRVDALIDNTWSYYYRQKNNPNFTLRLASLRDANYPVTCLCSEQSSEISKTLVQSMNNLLNQGKIRQLMAKYLSPKLHN
ncbi:substrate-binding periplasmic protein [Zooshikella harenae]|uniref:Transporter substrate-binding domain-containing protein n=1 Tax=Zooshikella harenae TaxID=2827238 RepID=A0ABS5ZEI7_9GAMM|nr:transporter substrate-binding domain-containing protein [Zooshikella harenae]MBU2712472.1 transporter substrate-binding domain-containing protein [Zooshikella harenae]